MSWFPVHKTILSSIVIEDLIAKQRTDPNIGIGFIYCNYQRQDSQNIHDFLASLLRQFSQQRSSIPDVLKALHSQHDAPNSDTLLRTLYSVLALYSKTFIVIDALDECQEKYRKEFCKVLSEIQAISASSIFVTSRFIPDVLARFKSSPSLKIRASKEDVQKYLENNMNKLPAFVETNSKLQEEIKSSISEAVDGM